VRGRGRDRRSLEATRSLSRVDACNPPTASAPDLGAGRTRRPRDSHLSHAGLRPPRSPPFALALALDPSGLGHAATFTRRLRDPPVSERRQKGTPRRMEEYTKPTISILDHSHSIFAHSIGILSDLSSVLVVNLVLFI
jgi:hypothetical protein